MTSYQISTTSHKTGTGEVTAIAEHQSSWKWVDDNLRRVTAARTFSNALVECDPEDRLDFLEGAHEVLRAGWPGVPFGSVMDEAAFWGDMASRSELKAYALVCYERMSPQDQSAFLKYVQGRVDR